MAMALDAVWLRVKNVCKQNGLLIMSVLAVVIGCLLGFFLRTQRLTEQVSPSQPRNPVMSHREMRGFRRQYFPCAFKRSLRHLHFLSQYLTRLTDLFSFQLNNVSIFTQVVNKKNLNCIYFTKGFTFNMILNFYCRGNYFTFYYNPFI